VLKWLKKFVNATAALALPQWFSSNADRAYMPEQLLVWYHLIIR